MNELSAQIEVLLLVSAKPITLKRLAAVLKKTEAEIEAAATELMTAKNTPESGVHIMMIDRELQLVTNPAFGEAVNELTREELDTELTRPQLETLTIIAYRGPITKPEIETVRGVNCALILRNLMMRGLVEEREDSVRLQAVYSVSADFLRTLGLHSVEELPDFNSLHTHAKITQLIDAVAGPSSAEASEGEPEVIEKDV